MTWTADAWFLTAAAAPLEQRSLELGDPGPDEAIVEVLGNGMCHTDLGFADGGVRPNHELPLVLGHEVVGRVVDAGDAHAHLVGDAVIVPAVLPCGDCALCAAGRGNACAKQKMPGNDIHGGFATHMRVPAKPLVSLRDAPEGFDLRSLAVVADAVSTAFQATRRASLASGDLAIVLGAGGVGGYLVQIASALGAKVIALDVDAQRLARIRDFGADAAIHLDGSAPREVRKQVRSIAREMGIGGERQRVFECAGRAASQEQAFVLLERAATLVQVGFTPEKVNLRFSNLMALDATVHGTWGCPPEAYADVLDLIFTGRVQLDPFLDYAPLSQVNDKLADMRAHRLDKRVVLCPGD
jgi:6-hydroxycyclohex-1-ene-1-carbonyl-CoA dehydrogenase